MEFIKQVRRYKVKEEYLTQYLQVYWFIPSDVLQRGIEANIWDLCRFRKPILDIGVGNGKISKFIFRRHPQIDVGIDSDERGLKSAIETKKYIKILHANAEKLPFKDESFNTVLSNSTFEHIKNDLKAIAESARALKKDGLFFITVPSEFLQKWILEFEKKRNNVEFQRNLINFNKRTNHLHYRSLESWTRHFKKNNLELIFYKYYFPKKVAIFWYKLFKKFTYKLGKREIWSILGNSKITRFIPKQIIIKVLGNIILKNAYNKGFFIKSGKGAQLFMIAKKI